MGMWPGGHYKGVCEIENGDEINRKVQTRVRWEESDYRAMEGGDTKTALRTPPMLVPSHHFYASKYLLDNNI